MRLNAEWRGPDDVFDSWPDDLRQQVVDSLVRRGFLTPPTSCQMAEGSVFIESETHAKTVRSKVKTAGRWLRNLWQKAKAWTASIRT